MKTKNNNKNDKSYPIWIYILIASFLIIIVFSTYFANFNDEFSTDSGDWGTFGDFIGGTLNPLLAFLSLIALLTTIRIQSKELRASTEQLSLSKDELEKTTKALQDQSYSIKLQNFENTFFNLMKLLNDIKKLTLLKKKVYNIKGNTFNMEHSSNNNESFKQLMDFLNRHIYDITRMIRSDQWYKFFYKNFEYILTNYFRNVYQILKFIHSSEIKDKKFYTNILRSQFTKDEIELLFYHCVSDFGNEKFLPLLIHYEFLEHLECHKNINEKDILYCVEKTRSLNNSYPDSKLFGSTKEWENKIEELLKDPHYSTI